MEGPSRKRLKLSALNEKPGHANHMHEMNHVNVPQGASQPNTNASWDSDDEDSDEYPEIPSDTLAALGLLKNEFPKLQGVSSISSSLKCGVNAYMINFNSLFLFAARCTLTTAHIRTSQVSPFATKNQLYTVLKDKTTADRELDELK